VAPTVIYVATNGTSAFPYDTWAKAATNIQNAVDAARVVGTNASMVLVTNGAYATASQISIAKGITVRSVNGAASTTIRRAGGASFGVLYLSAAGAILDGFTITNGVGDASYGGAATIDNGATLRRCVVTLNGGYNGAGVRMGSGLIDACQILTNASFNGGGIHMSGGMVSNTIIRGNTCSGNTGGGVHNSAGTLRNCLVTLNTGARLGGGIYMDGAGSIENCTIVTNTASGTYSTGGGLYASAGGAINCVVAYNRTTGGGGTNDDVRTNDVSRCSFSCAPELTNGNNNAPGDPQFAASPDSPYRPKVSSPCFNRGTNLTCALTEVDLSGQPRIRAKIVDMGCYESGDLPGTVFLIQ